MMRSLSTSAGDAVRSAAPPLPDKQTGLRTPVAAIVLPRTFTVTGYFFGIASSRPRAQRKPVP